MNISTLCEEDSVALSHTLTAIFDPVRREIVELLKSGSRSAGDIASHFNLSSATVSYHLSQLKKADLITEIRYKHFIYYEINVSVFEE